MKRPECACTAGDATRLRRVRVFVPALALLLLAAPLRADDEVGRRLTREAQRALQLGEVDAALQLAEQARIEWPGAPEVAHTLGDVYFHRGDHAAALREYDKGSAGDGAFRAFFNQGVTYAARAEQGLQEAGVPLEPAGLAAEAPPGPLIAAIDAAVPDLEQARGRFVSALVERPDAAARESIAALNQRLDDLAAMREELERRQQEEEEQQDQQDQQDGDQQQDQQDQKDQQDGQEGEDGDEQQGEPPADQPPNEQEGQPGDQQPPDTQDEQQQEQQGDAQDEQGQEPPPAADEQQPPGTPQPAEAQHLTPEELADLMEQLEELEEKARLMQRIRQAQQRRAVEKDW